MANIIKPSDEMEAAANDEADVAMLVRGVDPNDLETARSSPIWAITQQAAVRKYDALWLIAHPNEE